MNYRITLLNRILVAFFLLIPISGFSAEYVKLSDYYSIENVSPSFGKGYTKVFYTPLNRKRRRLIGTIEYSNWDKPFSGKALTSLKMSTHAISIDGKSILYWHRKVSFFSSNKDEGIYWHQIDNDETLLYLDDELHRKWTKYDKPLPENVMVIPGPHEYLGKTSLSDVMALYADDGLLKPLGLYSGNDLHKAVYANNIKLVKELIESGIDIDELTYWNDSPLNIAVKKGFSEIAIYLIEQGASYISDKSTRLGSDHSVIENAVFLQRLGVIKAIQDKGTKLDDPELFRKALFYNHSEIIEDDINNVNIQTIPKIIRLLIKDGGNPNADGLGIIIKVVENKRLHGSQIQLEVLTLLLEHGVDPIALDDGPKYYSHSKKYYGRRTALHHISSGRGWNIDKEGTRKVIDLIAKYSAHLETRSKFGRTALQTCMLRVDLEINYKKALYLIELGADDSVEYLYGAMGSETGISIRDKIAEMEAAL